jgi:hypothetical protein
MFHVNFLDCGSAVPLSKHIILSHIINRHAVVTLSHRIGVWYLSEFVSTLSRLE